MDKLEKALYLPILIFYLFLIVISPLFLPIYWQFRDKADWGTKKLVMGEMVAGDKR